MSGFPFGDYLVAWSVTVAVETLALALLFGYRRPADLLDIALVNSLTNPLMNLSLAYCSLRFGPAGAWGVASHEAAVMLVEAFLYSRLIGGPPRRLLAASLAANGLSFLAGLAIAGSPVAG